MATTLSDFYQDVHAGVIEQRPVMPKLGRLKPPRAKPSDEDSFSSEAFMALGRPEGPVLSAPVSANTTASAHQDSAHLVIEAGRNYEELGLSHKSLVNLLNQARVGNPLALHEIVENYGYQPDELEITVTQPLRDAQGREPELYGIKLIKSEEEWVAMTRDWETASAYFPGIELHCLPTTRRGRKLAVVMGVAAKEFNAVIAAERSRQGLEATMKAYDSEIEKGRKEMGVDKMPRVQTGNDKKPVSETPGQDKAPRAKSLPPR